VIEHVTNSGTAMPPFKNTLSKQQIENVAAYVTTNIAK
jgi:mono/diheme cytochrome c family protein